MQHADVLRGFENSTVLVFQAPSETQMEVPIADEVTKLELMKLNPLRVLRFLCYLNFDTLVF